MAEERSVGLARAPEARSDSELTKEELQRRMEEARESITQTVAEIKETVTNQYIQVKEQISETLDWREQFRRRPVPFIVGAVGVGLALGYSVGAAVTGGDDEDEDDYDERDEDLQASIRASGAPARSYAAQAITGGHPAYTPAPAPPQQQDVGPDTRASFTSASTALVPVEQPAPAEPPEPDRPGIIERIRESGLVEKFKETKAYDRLQDELGSIGERVVEELSQTARNVVVPALLSKVKDLIGIDLTTQREVAQRSKLEKETAHVHAQKQAVDEQATPPGASASGASAAGGGH